VGPLGGSCVFRKDLKSQIWLHAENEFKGCNHRKGDRFGTQFPTFYYSFLDGNCFKRIVADIDTFIPRAQKT